MAKEFEWTDDLVNELVDHARRCFNNPNNNYQGKYSSWDIDFEKWKKSKQVEDRIEVTELELTGQKTDGTDRKMYRFFINTTLSETQLPSIKEAIERELNPQQKGMPDELKSDMKDNAIELLKEDIECVHKLLDQLDAPRKDEEGTPYSINGRISALFTGKAAHEVNSKEDSAVGKWQRTKADIVIKSNAPFGAHIELPTNELILMDEILEAIVNLKVILCRVDNYDLASKFRELEKYILEKYKDPNNNPQTQP